MAGLSHAMPPYLDPLWGFVNTLYVEDGTELFTDPAALTTWLRKRRLLDRATTATRAEFRLALDLRTALRALALANNGVPATADARALAAACFARLPLIATPDGTGLAPRPTAPVIRALAHIAAGYAAARASGDWSRLRRCPADDCASMFWDSSARAARRWCNMRVCGNRAKSRAYARRHRPGSSASLVGAGSAG
jgi:predicted RNA-binding Zn ribbon-like protein